MRTMKSFQNWLKMKSEILEAELALDNWQKYNDDKSDEVVYQAEKVASSLDKLLDKLAEV